MSDPVRVVSLYQRFSASGAELHSCAGVRAAVKSGDDPAGASATWNVEAVTLGGLRPRAGDRMRGPDGVWWTVRAVGPLAGGAYPCTSDRVPEGTP